MAGIISLVVLGVLLYWLLGPRSRKHRPAPEDDVSTPIDKELLAEAEEDLARDARARALEETMDDDEDWGPGAP